METVGTPVRLDFGRFRLDERNARLLRDGNVVELAPRPFAVLCALAREPGALCTKNGLLDEVWGHRHVSDSVLKTVIGKLRIALEDDPRNPCFIETVPRRGYRFIAEITPLDGASHSRPGGDETTPERALRELKELLRRCTGAKPLLLFLEHPHAADRAAVELMRYISSLPGGGDAPLSAS